jgi:hypothetical protein
MRTVLRILTAAALSLLLLSSVAGIAVADVSSKTINTTVGECVNSGDPPALSDGTTPCGAAVYGANGFSGRIHGTGSATLIDYICDHTPGTGPFVSYGGTYTFSIFVGGAPAGSTTETVTSGVSCTTDTNAVTDGAIEVIFPVSGYVDYTVSIAGVNAATATTTFGAHNSILNRVLDTASSSHANSPSVAPPTPPAEVPEAPASALLVVTAGLVAGGVLLARSRRAARSA